MPLASRVAFRHVNRALIERAKEHFGITPDFRKGAWLLPDGTLLDFGGKKERMDHSDIKAIFPDEFKEQDPEKYIPENDYIRKKFLETGAIRMVVEGGGVEITQKPTEAQLSKIREFFKWIPLKDFFIDLSGKGQDFSKQYNNNEAERAEALSVIEKYFKGDLKNLSEVQRFRYSDETRRHLQEEPPP